MSIAEPSGRFNASCFVSIMNSSRPGKRDRDCIGIPTVSVGGSAGFPSLSIHPIERVPKAGLK